MDTRTPAVKGPDEADRQVAMIKGSMPLVYAAVQEKAKAIGREAFALVRRGARGEPGCFYAFERGRTVGTPFPVKLPDDIGQLVAQYGVQYLCMWPDSAKDDSHGPH